MQGLFEKGMLVSVLQSFTIVLPSSLMAMISSAIIHLLWAKNMNWCPSNTNSYQALGLPKYCLDANSRHLEYLLTWKLRNCWSGHQKAFVPALGQPLYFYCHNRLRNTLHTPKELNRQKTLGWDAGDETFSISSWAENAPRARAGLLQTFSARRQEAQVVQWSSALCWGAAPQQLLQGSETLGREAVTAPKLKLQAAFPWQCWDTACCFIIMFWKPPPSCPDFQLAFIPIVIANTLQMGRKTGRTILCRLVAGGILEKSLYVTTTSFLALSPKEFSLVDSLTVYLKPHEWNGNVVGMAGEGKPRQGSKAVGCKIWNASAWTLFLVSANFDLSRLKC